MDKSSFLVDIGTIVSRLKNVDVAYIFGSFLEGEEFNDIDIALLLSKNLNPYKSLKFSLKVNWRDRPSPDLSLIYASSVK